MHQKQLTVYSTETGAGCQNTWRHAGECSTVSGKFVDNIEDVNIRQKETFPCSGEMQNTSYMQWYTVGCFTHVGGPIRVY